MSASDLVARLAQQGIDPTLLSEVAEALFTGEIEARKLDERRSGDRRRKQAQRSRDVTGQCVTSEEVTERVSLDKKDPQTPKELNPSRVCETRARFAAPFGVSETQWGAFRKQRKKPINERSYALLCNKLKTLSDAGWPPGEMIDLAIERGWETVFEPRNDNGRRNTLGRNQPADGLSSTARAALDVFGA